MTDTEEPEDDFRLFFFPQFFPQKPFRAARRWLVLV
jgi:hypothetical protein